MRELGEKLAFIRVGALGDLLIGTAALADAIERFPGDVTVVGSLLWTQILKPSVWPRVREIAVVRSKNTLEIFLRDELRDRWKTSRAEDGNLAFWRGFSAVVNTRYESYRYAWRPWLARVPMRLGSCPKTFRFLFTHWAPWLGKDPLKHERDLILRLTHARADHTEPGWDIQHWKKKGLPPLTIADGSSQSTASLTRSRVLINPTSSRREKAWPSDRFRDLALALKRGGFEVAIVGAPGETVWLREVAGEDLDLLQPRDIFELVEMVSQARLLISNTSSLQYIAAAQDTPVLTLMGNSKPEQWGPLGESAHFIKADEKNIRAKDIFRREVEAFESIEVDTALHRIVEILDGLR